jgi:hypothetical protein
MTFKIKHKVTPNHENAKQLNNGLPMSLEGDAQVFSSRSEEDTQFSSPVITEDLYLKLLAKLPNSEEDPIPGWYQFSSPTRTDDLKDLNLELTDELLELKLDEFNVGMPTINTIEITEYEKVSSKISAIVAVSGILKDFDEEQVEAFKKAINRRSLSEDE